MSLNIITYCRAAPSIPKSHRSLLARIPKLVNLSQWWSSSCRPTHRSLHFLFFFMSPHDPGTCTHRFSNASSLAPQSVYFPNSTHLMQKSTRHYSAPLPLPTQYRYLPGVDDSLGLTFLSGKPGRVSLPARNIIYLSLFFTASSFPRT